jgi:hypothetical protein
MILKMLKVLFALLIVFVSLFAMNAPTTFADGETELPVFNTLSGGMINKIRMSPDGRILLTMGNPNTYLWNVGSGVNKKLDILTNQTVYDAAFSPDGSTFAVSVDGNVAGKILLFDSKSGELTNTINVRSDDLLASSIAFSADSKNLIAQVRGSVEVINLASKTSTLQYDTDISSKMIRHNPINDEIALLIADYQRTPTETNSFAGNLKTTVQIRDEKTGEIKTTLSDFLPLAGNDNSFADMIYSQEGRYLVVSHSDGTKGETVIFDATNGYQQVSKLDSFGTLSFSKDGKLMVVGNKVYPIDEKFASSYNIKVKNSDDAVPTNLSMITPDGKYLLFVKDGSIKLLDAAALPVRLTALEIGPKDIKLNVNSTASVTLTGIYSDGSQHDIDLNKVSWSTQDFSVAEVKDSVLHSRSNGTTTLTANYGGLTATTQVTVADAPTVLQAVYGSDGVKLTWTGVKNTNGLLGYNLYRRTTTGSYSSTPINDFPLQKSEYTDLNIDSHQDYNYICKAVYKGDKGNIESEASNEAFVTPKSKQIILQVNNPIMKVNGESQEIDPGNGTTPVIYNGRTLLPIRALIDALGGKLDWLDSEQKITIQFNGQKIELWVGKNSATVNGVIQTLDVPPTIINQRTMLPLRFIAENLGCKLDWDGTTQTVALTLGGGSNDDKLPVSTTGTNSSKWYETEYTQPVSDTFGKYIDGGVGFSINYPLAWGKPKVTESDQYDFGTYTTFYESPQIKIIAYGKNVKGTYDDYLKNYQKQLMENNYTPPSEEISVKNADKAYLIDLEPGMTKTINYVAFKNGEAVHIEAKLTSVSENDELEKVLDLFIKMMKSFELSAAAG